MLSAPTTLLARRLGLKEIINIADLKLPYVHSGLVTRRTLARQQPQRLRAFLKAYVTSIKISNENAEISKRALGRYLATDDGAVIDEAYNSFRGVFPKMPYFSEEHIRSVLAVTDYPRPPVPSPSNSLTTDS